MVFPGGQFGVFELPGYCLGAASEDMEVAFPNATLMVPFGGRRGASGCSIWFVFEIPGGCLRAAFEDFKVAFPDATLMVPFLGRPGSSR